MSYIANMMLVELAVDSIDRYSIIISISIGFLKDINLDSENKNFQHRKAEKKTSPTSTSILARHHSWLEAPHLTARPVSVHNKWKAVELVESCAEFHWPQLRPA